MLETAITKKIKAALESSGAWVYKVHGGAFARAGVPDLLCCYHGMFIAIEVKRPGNTATKAQEFEIAKITESGGLAVVMSDPADVPSVLAEASKRFRRRDCGG